MYIYVCMYVSIYRKKWLYVLLHSMQVILSPALNRAECRATFSSNNCVHYRIALGELYGNAPI